MSNGYRFLGKAPLRTFDKWHLFISLALTALFIFSIIKEKNTGMTFQPPTPASLPHEFNDSSSNRAILKAEIEQGKRRAMEMESQMQKMDKRLKDYENQMDSYRELGLRDDYNALVPTYNSLVLERNGLYKEYSQLIIDINANVKRYNSGLR